jgi:putative membrane protein
MQTRVVNTENTSYWVIGVLSVVIPLAVAILIYMPAKLDLDVNFVSFLPHLNGVINTVTSLILVAGLIFIKQRKIQLHKTAMMSAFVLGSIFLVSYIVYHASAPSTVYGDLDGDGVLSLQEEASIGYLRGVYLSILISHIILAVAVVPFVLLAVYYAFTDNHSKHRKAVKFAYPIWLYVSITGVIVYLMISSYYQY